MRHYNEDAYDKFVNECHQFKVFKIRHSTKKLGMPYIQIIYAKSLKEIFQIWQQSYLHDIANNEFEAAINVSKLSKIKTKF